MRRVAYFAWDKWYVIGGRRRCWLDDNGQWFKWCHLTRCFCVIHLKTCKLIFSIIDTFCYNYKCLQAIFIKNFMHPCIFVWGNPPSDNLTLLYFTYPLNMLLENIHHFHFSSELPFLFFLVREKRVKVQRPSTRSYLKPDPLSVTLSPPLPPITYHLSPAR